MKNHRQQILLIVLSSLLALLSSCNYQDRLDISTEDLKQYYVGGRCTDTLINKYIRYSIELKDTVVVYEIITCTKQGEDYVVKSVELTEQFYLESITNLHFGNCEGFMKDRKSYTLSINNKLNEIEVIVIDTTVYSCFGVDQLGKTEIVNITPVESQVFDYERLMIVSYSNLDTMLYQDYKGEQLPTLKVDNVTRFGTFMDEELKGAERADAKVVFVKGYGMVHSEIEFESGTFLIIKLVDQLSTEAFQAEKNQFLLENPDFEAIVY